jgi:AcrR family transcriptional regulator
VTRPRGGGVIVDKQAEARLAVSRHACDLFWEHGVSSASGDDIAAAAGLSTRTIWRYFRSKESCVEPVLTQTMQRFLRVLERWPAELSLADHLVTDAELHPLAQQEIDDEIRAMRIAAVSSSEPALRTAYLMAHDQMERGFIPAISKRLHLTDDDLTVRLCAAAVTGALRVVDEDVSKAIVIDKKEFPHGTVLALIDRAIQDATNGRLGGPITF